MSAGPQPLAEGQTLISTFETDRSHSAESYGNPGVDVLATPALVGLVEIACHRMIVPHLAAGEASVGTRVDLSHLAASPIGVAVKIEARVVGIDGLKILFEAEARARDVAVMRGEHTRAIVDFAGLKAKMAERFS